MNNLINFAGKVCNSTSQLFSPEKVTFATPLLAATQTPLAT